MSGSVIRAAIIQHGFSPGPGHTQEVKGEPRTTEDTSQECMFPTGSRRTGLTRKGGAVLVGGGWGQQGMGSGGPV